MTPTPTLEGAEPTATPTPALINPDALCLGCHSSMAMTLTLPSGEILPLDVDTKAFQESVHGSKLVCLDCHQNYSQYPHPTREIANIRDYTIAQYEVCRRCHFASYTRTLDSIHYDMLSQGNKNAPVCVDCHGAHDISPPDEPRVELVRTCSTCHEAVYETYLSSVHGEALVDEENEDVPTCTYCHGVHNIYDPRTASFRVESPELCSECHANETLMNKYGISTQVFQTYLEDFHGVSVTFLRKGSPDILSYEAVCTDCHGVHDITRVDDPSSPVLKANLVGVCQRCHPDANENFPGAWLSHYEPSAREAPLVFGVKVFYRVFIPLMVGGLAVQILLNLWKAATSR